MDQVLEKQVLEKTVIILDVYGTLSAMMPYDVEIPYLLRVLEEEGYRVILASGEKDSNAAKGILTRSRLSYNSWPKIYQGINKTTPEGFFELLTSLGVSPDACILIDDSTTNIATAHAVGIQTIRFQEDPSQVGKYVYTVQKGDKAREIKGSLSQLLDLITSIRRGSVPQRLLPAAVPLP